MIIKFLLNERADVHDIADRLQTQFSEHIYQFQTAQFWIPEVRFGCQYLHDEIGTGRPSLDDLDAKILAILAKSPSEPARSIVGTLHIADSTAFLHLHDSLGFRSFHLHWVPYLLTYNLRGKRKEYAKAILQVLSAAECDSWDYLVTGDESWFCLNISSSRTWTLSRDHLVTKSRLDIQSKTIVSAIVWNPNSFSVFETLPNEIKMSSDYFMRNTFIPFEQAIFSRRKAPHQNPLMVHLDNSLVDTSRASTD
jgi:hypothetical protein